LKNSILEYGYFEQLNLAKIIENHQTETKGGITKYKYNFDGLSYEKDGQTASNTYKNVFGIEDNFNISETKEQ
jgi:hypothetical protein